MSHWGLQSTVDSGESRDVDLQSLSEVATIADRKGMDEDGATGVFKNKMPDQRMVD